ncbi:DUF6376 family protein [Metabacillus litoralis]|uniref:DUF6376 family protein n=1 Tax=Metabacillus litoralis TaxID=152268 RepID=UPI001CFD324F|nr:DUF6376 family protein [Metabacillus litoralis]
MKLMVFSITTMLFLGGCSLLEDVNNSVTYVNEATEYVGEVNTFVSEVPTLAEQAVSDELARLDLESKLTDMKEDIEAFNELQAPELANDLHQQIIEHNNTALEGIDLYLHNIKDGKFDTALLENSEFFTSLQEITDTVDQIKELGL